MVNRIPNKCLKLAMRIVYGFYVHDGFQKANALAYTFLMSFVPFFISLAAVITLFIPPQVYAYHQKQIFAAYLPVIGKQVAQYVLNFQIHALDLSIISLTLLFITSLLMINTLRSCLDQLLGLKGNDMTIGFRLILIVAVFIGLILSGVVLLGIHEVATHYVPRYTSRGFSFIIIILQYLTSFTAFSLIYKFVPHSRVEFRHAFSAGAVAAVLFEIAKFGFALYIRLFSNMQNLLYGSLVAIPIFLFWLYIISVIILLGARVITELKKMLQ